jgi:hypothetical protein
MKMIVDVLIGRDGAGVCFGVNLRKMDMFREGDMKGRNMTMVCTDKESIGYVWKSMGSVCLGD